MKKRNWRIRGIRKDRLQLISYQGSDFMGEPVVFRTTVSDINPNTGRHWSTQQRDKLCSRFDAECAKGNISHHDTITVAEMCEKVWHTSANLIKGAYGDPMYNNNLWEWLNDFLKANGIRHVRFHDLRHTYVSMLRSFGADIVEISHEARHSQKTTTLNIYSHLFMDATEMKRKNAMKNSNTLFPSANSCPIHAQKKNQR